MKQRSDVTDKILTTAARMRKSVAFMSTSVLVLPLVTPIKDVSANEKATANESNLKRYSTNPFLNTIIPSATSIAAKNDLYASVMMAQAILESGWGQSTLSAPPNHNLFGIKGDYEGESVEKNTLEDNGNQEYYEIQAEFRKYPSYQQSLEDYAALLRNGTSWDPFFYSGAWKSNTTTYQDATQYLTGRYATDTAYASKLNRIIEQHQLMMYDTPADPSITPPVKEETVQSSTYTVKKGDTLYSIARQHQISLVDLMAWNQLNSSMIQPGMKLKVNNQTTPTPVAPSPAPAETVTETPSVGSTYKVQAGDSLWGISQKTKVSVANLKAWNQLQSDVIHPGQVLKLSNAQTTEKETATPPKETTPTTSTRKSVKVGAGDTLYRIATQAGISVSSLKTINQLKSDLIVPGQVLYLETAAVTEVKPTTPAPVEQEKPVQQAQYTVQRGDTLYQIAQKTGASVSQLKAWNQITSDLIFVGQTLQLKQEAATPQVQKPKDSTTYQVQKGDTLYSIAKKHGVSLTDLMEWNNVNSALIHPGQSLKVQ